MTDTRPGTEETLQSLVSEMNGLGGGGEDGDAEPAARTEAVVEETAATLYDGDSLSIEEGLVKESLPNLLTALVELRRSETHGKGVMEDLERFFGVDLSPGTVYPVLHDLEEGGLLSVHELVQTKEYSIDDGDAARQRLEDAMGQHLALGLVFRRALEGLDESDDGDDTTIRL
ncbi:PadR family transcriptional regulator [Natronomonas marina]|jgi:DNA-binding PadR family transcriptional regulator|uniref:PadR family transcriptional regulator n=1 Tax=Natronomonas marina TaxID=2961939 RepID=UPI0020CA0BCF|nr:PadR family transcriptional regulator [Natronomonas marina]